MEEAFLQYNDYFEKELERKENIKNETRKLDKLSREAQMRLQRIHKRDPNISEICNNIKQLYPQFVEIFTNISNLVPEGQHYRYSDSWQYNLRQLLFYGVFVYWLENGTLATKDEILEIIGLNQIQGFQIDIEDYLHGVVGIPSELARLCVNCVTRGDFSKPQEIQEFANDLYGGLRLLNLKNDILRKRFDATKYDIKKIEEVVYDISIRGLTGK